MTTEKAYALYLARHAYYAHMTTRLPWSVADLERYVSPHELTFASVAAEMTAGDADGVSSTCWDRGGLLDFAAKRSGLLGETVEQALAPRPPHDPAEARYWYDDESGHYIRLGPGYPTPAGSSEAYGDA